MPKKNDFKIFYAISFATQLGFIIAFPITGFLFLGILADKFLKTQPLFLVIGGFIGIIMTIYEVYHFLIPLIKNDDKND